MCIRDSGKTGYMSSVRNTTAPAEEWIAGGVPITMMMKDVDKRQLYPSPSLVSRPMRLRSKLCCVPQMCIRDR